MAGGKETPRQKLINLMYLVLLALLALQVSSVIIEKFQQLNSSLEDAITDSEIRNIDILNQIKQQVKNGKFAKEDVKVQKSAEQLRKETLALLSFLNVHKENLIELTGGRDERGNLVGAKEEEAVSNYMLGAGDSKAGKGYELQTRLNTYASLLNRISNKHQLDITFNPLAMDGKDDPIFKNNPDQRKKDFAELNFEGTPLVAALAMMSERGNKVMTIESEVLAKLAVKVGAINIPVDKVRPVVLAGSNKILAGTDFQADLFMAAYSSNFKPEMTFEGKALEVSQEGVGKIDFRASGGNYNEDGMIKKTWKGTIKYPKSGGGDTIYNVEYEYYVLRPVIEDVSSLSATLYKDCGNEISFKVAGLGVDFNPKFKVSGAKLRQTATRGKVVIIPNDPITEVKIYNNDTYLGMKQYKVKLIPKPDLVVKCGGRTIDPVKGVDIGRLRNVEVIPIPDAGFRASNPADASYRTVQFKAELIRNGRSRQTLVINGQQGSLRDLELQSNDRVILTDIKVKRKNFENQIVPVDIGEPVFIIPIL